MQGDFDCLTLLGKAGQHFDQAAQEGLARNQQIEQDDKRGEQVGGNSGGSAEQRAHGIKGMQRRSLWRRRGSAKAGDALQLSHHPVQRADWAREEGQLLLDLRQCVRQFARPVGGRPRCTADQCRQYQDKQQDGEQCANRPRQVGTISEPHQRLQQQLDYNG